MKSTLKNLTDLKNNLLKIYFLYFCSQSFCNFYELSFWLTSCYKSIKQKACGFVLLCKTEKDKSLLQAFCMRMIRTVGSILAHAYANKFHLPHKDIGQPGSQKLELMYQKIANTAWPLVQSLLRTVSPFHTHFFLWLLTWVGKACCSDTVKVS